MGKYYFRKNDDLCYTIKHHKEWMKKIGIKKLELIEAGREKLNNLFFCKFHCDICEVGGCGKHLKCYIPNNGKSGRCKHYGYFYEPTDKIKTIRI